MRRLLALLASLIIAAPAWALPPSVQAPAGQQPFVATGAPTPRTAADRAADVFNAADWGVKCDSSDETARITALLNAAAAVNGKVTFPRGTCVFGPYTFPANSAVEIAGQGPGATTLAETSGANADFLTFAPSTVANHYLHDLRIRGSSWGNTSGSCIVLPDDTNSGEYGRGMWMSRVVVDSCATNGMTVGKNRGAGIIESSVLQHAGTDTFNINSSADWRVHDNDFGSAGGNCVTVTGSSDFRAEGNHFYNCTNGVQVSTTSAAADFFLNNSFDTNNQNGFVMDSSGMANGTVLMGNRFTSNSASATNTYSDIVLTNTSGEIITNNTFFWGKGTQTKYLLNAGTGAGTVNWLNNSWGFVNGSLPYGTAVSNNANLVSIASGTNALLLSGSTGSAASGTNSIAGGNTVTVSGGNSVGLGANVLITGGQSVGLGRFASDHARNGCLVYANNQFSNLGDIDSIRCPMQASTTTNATATLATDGGSPGSGNVLNLPNDDEALTCRAGTVIANNPATGDFATWNLPAFTLKRGTGAGSVTLQGLTAGTQTQGYATAALTGATLSAGADTTHGGLNLSGTGVSSTTLHWGFVADCLDIK